MLYDIFNPQNFNSNDTIQESVSSGKPDIIEESVTVSYNRFNERGLNPLVMYLEKNGFKVISLDAESKIKKRDGTPTKAVKLDFENGQRLELIFAFLVKPGGKIENASGSTFSAKVDGKKIPIQLGKKKVQTQKTLDLIIDFLKKSSPKTASKKIKASSEELATKKRTSKTAAKKLKEQEELNSSLMDERKEAKDSHDKNKTSLNVLERNKKMLLKKNEKLDQEIAELEAELTKLKTATEE